MVNLLNIVTHLVALFEAVNDGIRLLEVLIILAELLIVENYVM
jgi:hypothetical protein